MGVEGRYIHHTAVAKNFRHQGIGKELVKAAMRELEALGITKVALVAFRQNEDRNAFGEARGFTVRNDLVYRNKPINHNMPEVLMDYSFFSQWFRGFEKGLDEIDSNNRSRFLKHCAECCADTGVLQSYFKLYQTVNGKRDAFYSRLSELGNVRGEIVVPNREYLIYFPKCACDLHTNFGVNTPALCECSRQSIIYIGRCLWKADEIKVEQVNTVLSGSSECKFRVIFD